MKIVPEQLKTLSKIRSSCSTPARAARINRNCI